VDQNWTRNTGEDGRPGSVFIVARRASDVITDLCMAGRLSREHHDDDEDSPFWTPDLPDDPEPGWPLTNPSTRKSGTWPKRSVSTTSRICRRP
jgi:hypothetical protein